MARNPLIQRMGNMTALAKALSNNWDVEVVESGFECCTDGKVIKYPANADYLKDASKKVLHGILDHEITHVAEEREHIKHGQPTPMYVMKCQKTKRHAMFLNVYEDIRCESKYSEKYPGMAENLAEANKNSAQMFASRHGSDMERANFWHTIGSAIILKARGGDLSWLPNGFKPYLEAVSDLIDQSNYPSSKWVQDSERLAHETVRRIEEKAEELKEEQEKRESKKGEKGEDKEDSDKGSSGKDGDEASAGGDEENNEGDESEKGDSEGGKDDDEGNSDAAGGDSGDDDNSESNGDSENAGEGNEGDSDGDADVESDGDASGSESGGDEGDSAGKLTDEELSDAVDQAERALTSDCDATDSMTESKTQITEDAMHEAECSGRYIAHPKALAADREFKPFGDLNDYTRALESVRKQIGALRSKLLNVVRTRAASSTLVDQEDGDIDEAALHSVRTGNRRVFTEEVKGDTLDTAISILVDLSGSMGSGDRVMDKAWYAKRMVIALAETFNALGVPFEVIGFQNDRCVSRDFKYSRFEAFEYSIFKAFGEQFRRCRQRFSAITGGGNNADSEAVLYAAKRLADRRETRKIMFVVSDGLPAHAGDISKSRKHLKEIIKLVTGAGIEVLGIGAQCQGIADYYNKENGADYVIIDDLDTLAISVFKLMRAKLLSNLRKGV